MYSTEYLLTDTAFFAKSLFNHSPKKGILLICLLFFAKNDVRSLHSPKKGFLFICLLLSPKSMFDNSPKKGILFSCSLFSPKHCSITPTHGNVFYFAYMLLSRKSMFVCCVCVYRVAPVVAAVIRTFGAAGCDFWPTTRSSCPPSHR